MCAGLLTKEFYLVTVQEEAWESFTEDEAPKPSQKPAAVKSSAGGTDKPKKAAPKTTQGSIASFFTKK